MYLLIIIVVNGRSGHLLIFEKASVDLVARVTAVYLTFIETCKLMKRVSLDFFKGFFDMTSGGRSDYELITQELLC